MKHMKISDPTGKPSTSPDSRRADVRGIRIDTIGQLEGRLKAKAMLVRPLLLSEERGFRLRDDTHSCICMCKSTTNTKVTKRAVSAGQSSNDTREQIAWSQWRNGPPFIARLQFITIQQITLYSTQGSTRRLTARHDSVWPSWLRRTEPLGDLRNQNIGLMPVRAGPSRSGVIRTTKTGGTLSKTCQIPFRIEIEVPGTRKRQTSASKATKRGVGHQTLPHSLNTSPEGPPPSPTGHRLHDFTPSQIKGGEPIGGRRASVTRCCRIEAKAAQENFDIGKGATHQP
jgi:hypothetical protein